MAISGSRVFCHWGLNSSLGSNIGTLSLILLMTTALCPVSLISAEARGTFSEAKRYERKGDELFAREAYHGAATYYQRASDSSKEDWELHLKLGRALARIGRDKEALKELFHSMLLNEKFPERNILARGEVASLLLKDGNYDEAGGQLKQILDFDPDNRPARGNYAICLQSLGFLDAACQQYSILLESQPDDTIALYNLGKVYLSKKDYQKAKASFGRVLQLDPQHTLAALGLGRALLDGGHSQSALALAKELALKQQNNYLVYNFLGDVLSGKEDKRGAAAAYRRSMLLNPRDSSSRQALAKLLRQSSVGETAGAHHALAGVDMNESSIAN